MLKRKATDRLVDWLKNKNKKCLVVQGARQTGKTYIIERFAGAISLLSPEYLLSYERWPSHEEPPDHFALLSYNS